MRIGYNFIGKLPLIWGIFLALIGKKRYFLALGTIPVNGVGFIGRKITVSVQFTAKFKDKYLFLFPEMLKKQTIMNALVKAIPLTSRGFLKCEGTYFFTPLAYVNIVTFGSKFLAIVTRFRDF